MNNRRTPPSGRHWGLPRWLAVWLIAPAITFSGCGPDAGRAEGVPHIKQITELYRAYVAANRGKRPADEAALKQYAKSLSPQLLGVMGIEDVESAFVSPQDQQPYVVAYASSKKTGPLLAYEAQATDGKRLVATQEGAISDMEEAKFQELLSTKI